MQKLLACVTSKGTRCKAGSFEVRAKIKNFVSEEEYQKIKKSLDEARKTNSIIDEETYPDIDNGDKHEWYSFGDGKYGRIMYCKKTGTFRHQTMGEFYEDSTVD